MSVQKWFPMHFFSAPKKTIACKFSGGFTLVEIAITVSVLGLLSAISAPSLLGWYSTKRVENALTEIKGALKKTRQAAIRGSQNCTLTIPEGISPTITANPANCLSTSEKTLKNITLRRSSTFATITFNFKGETGRSTPDTLVLLIPSDSEKQRCLVIDGPIGLIRTGRYLTSDTTGEIASNCITQQ